MMDKIENECLILEADRRGAELKKILVKGNPERSVLWDCDPEIWPWTAPVCSPWCGKINDGYFEAEGRRYSAREHGFVREYGHELAEQSDHMLRYLFHWKKNEERWPWDFSFETVHKLEGSQIITTCTITNEDQRDMPAQLGFHTGYACPLIPGEDITQYQFRCQKAGELRGSDVMPITRNLFDNKRILFEQLESEWIQLERCDGSCRVRVECKGFPYVLLWSMPGIPGFVCIEPWSGYNGSGNRLTDRPGTRMLGYKESLSCTQVITVEF